MSGARGNVDQIRQLVAEGGTRDTEQLAGASLGQAVFASEPDLLAPRLRAHHFFALISLSTVLLLTPASYHRIVEHGEETPEFFRVASGLVLRLFPGSVFSE